MLNKKILKKIVIVFSIFVIIIFALVYVFKTDLSVQFHKFAAELAFEYPNENTYTLWVNSIKNPIFIQELESKGVSSNLTSQLEQSTGEDIEAIVRVILNYNDSNNLGLYLVNQSEFKNYSPEAHKTIGLYDSNFPSGYKYYFKGEDGVDEINETAVTLETELNKKSKVLGISTTPTVAPKSQIEFEGTESITNLELELITLSQDTLLSLSKKQLVGIDYGIYDLDLLQDVKFKAISFIGSSEIKVSEQDSKFKIGEAKFLFEKCNYTIGLNIIYNFKTQTYSLENVQKILRNLCGADAYIYPETIEIATCEDCIYYPVDKDHRLSRTYKPRDLKQIPETNENIESIAYNDLIDLVNAAEDDGYTIRLSSSYRSYDTQIATFEYWTTWNQKTYGYDRPTAEKAANEVSAKPGFSEHQLGTTLDITAQKCAVPDETCKDNEALWAWLAENAFKYGFVMSYPESATEITGYTFEPWHYRWIGVDLARQFRSQTKYPTLNLWLEAWGLY